MIDVIAHLHYIKSALLAQVRPSHADCDFHLRANWFLLDERRTCSSHQSGSDKHYTNVHPT